MNILLTCEHYAVASGRYMLDALLRAGHTVHTQGPAMGNQLWGQTIDDKWVWVPNPPAKGWQPDVVLHMDGNWAPAQREYDCPHIVYGVDNHVRDYHHFPRNDVVRVDWDHLFLGHNGGQHIGEANVTWLPCAYDPVYFTPGKPWADRQFDAALIGWLSSNRNTAIYSISSQLTRADGSPIQFAFGTGPIYDQYAAIYQDARISVVVSAAGDVAQRVFETAAMGCLVIMDDAHDAETLGLVNGANCLIYPRHNFTALVGAVDFVLRNPEEAQRVAVAGQAWAQPHTWDARAAFIVDWLTHERQSEVKPKPRAPKREKVETDGD